MKSSRGPLLVLLLLIGSALLVSGSLTWVNVVLGDSAGVTIAVTGNDLVPLLGASGGVALGGVAALLLLRGWGRSAVGMVVALVLAVLSAQLLSGFLDRWMNVDVITAIALRRGGVALAGTSLGAASLTWEPIATLTVVVALLGVLIAGAIALRAPRWPRASRRYDRESIAQDDAAGQWDALSAGDDPTAALVHEKPPTAQ